MGLVIMSAGFAADMRLQAGANHLQALQQQGIPPESIEATDPDGIPLVCATGLNRKSLAQGSQPGPSVAGIPSGTRTWECVPGVIRNNGTDTFRLEVDVNGPVSRVTLKSDGIYTTFVSGPATQDLRDDGLNGDRKASDYVFTSGALRYNTNWVMDAFYGYDTNSPSGLFFYQFGQLQIVETNSITNEFLISPKVGVLRTDIPAVETVFLTSNVLVSAHLINIQTTNRWTQKGIRLGYSLQDVTKPIYTVLPDAFDLFTFFSADHLENVNRYASENYFAGLHQLLRVNYTGTGLATFNNSSPYGSAGRLLGWNILDAATRGVDANNATHELVHQWASFTDTSLDLSKGDGHYVSTCSADSLVGGEHWIDNGNGTYIRDCDELFYGPTNAPPLDKYMMGLIAGSAVPPVRITTNRPPCGGIITNVIKTVTIANIQAVHGVRTPTPSGAQKSFSLGFVAETYARLLNATEMTFYETLADYYTKAIPPQKPNPQLGSGWVPITRYFGEGTSWSTEVLPLIRPKIASTEHLADGSARITGTGYPGRNYRLLRTTNFFTWTAVTNKAAGTNGVFVLVDSSAVQSKSRFYRVATP
jgi:hypothetical protein